MKKLRYVFLAFILLLIVGWFVVDRQLNNGSLEPDNTVWTSFIGRDTTVGILPDQYANYFTYTIARTKKNVGFRIKGEFPTTRYFSFNVYSLGDNTTQGSLVDYQIKTDSGKLVVDILYISYPITSLARTSIMPCLSITIPSCFPSSSACTIMRSMTLEVWPFLLWKLFH